VSVRFEVWLTADAERDIEEIHRYIGEYDGAMNADRVLARLEEQCRRLEYLPARGNVPRELLRLGIKEYRQVHYKPYRIIYRIIGQRVIVYCILDGRRDMQSLLQRRLLR
jgi:toxin ParE1/3/4